jgi:hypothetical protein
MKIEREERESVCDMCMRMPCTIFFNLLGTTF